MKYLLERVVDDALQCATLFGDLDDHLEVHDLALAALERRDEQAAVRELAWLDARDVNVRGLFESIHSFVRPASCMYLALS